MAEIWMSYKVESQYSFTFPSEDAWVRFVTDISRGQGIELDSTDLDAVYDYIENNQFRCQEYLEDLVGASSWLGTTDTEISDLQRQAEARPDEMRSDT